MAKIGRNEKCPCRSGKKYKHCCARLHQDRARQLTQQQAMKVSLMGAVEEIQQDAVARRTICKEMGVFFFYSTSAGDGWVMEMTGCDCIQVASKGELLQPPIDENPDTIEVNWSHSYEVKNKQVVLTAYEDNSEEVLVGAPSKELNAAMKRIRKKFSQQELDRVHLADSEAGEGELSK